jgi:hypoxanthine phosphoribosyltransferase
MVTPKHFTLVYSKQQITDAVARLGAEITEWAGAVHREYHETILTVPVLGGGVFFFADLVRAVPYSLEMAPVRAWAYAAGVNAEPTPDLKVDMRDIPAKGRRVLLIDDVCDSGRTLEKLKILFEQAGASEVRSAVLIKRLLTKPTFEPDWVGFRYEHPEWFVGYGMDDNGQWRNLPSVYVMPVVA